MQQPDVSTPARHTAVSIENVIRLDAFENCALIATDGLVIVARKGRKNRVHLTVSELLSAAGMTFTHNHPDGHGPSLTDAEIAAQYEFKELRVVTADHRYGVEMLAARHRLPLLGSFHFEQGRAMTACRDEVLRGLLNPRDFPHEVLHRTWFRLSASLGFHYWREQS